MTEPLPGKGFLGWLGRQIGHVKRAIKTDVGEKTVYRDQRVREEPHPLDPQMRLRRTVIDEAIVRIEPLPGPKQPPSREEKPPPTR